MADDAESPRTMLLTLAAAGAILLLLNRRFASPIATGVAGAGALLLYLWQWPGRRARRQKRRARIAAAVNRAVA